MSRWVRSSGENVNIFRRISTPNTNNDINLGDLWADLSVTPPVLMKCTSLSPVTWVSAEGTASGGETNTASNVGNTGVGVFKQKTIADLEFKKIDAGSNKITITNDVDNSTIDIDIAQGNLSLGSIGGSVSYTQIQNISATDKLLGRVTAGAGIIEEITLTSAGRALIDDADNIAQRTTLGLGTLATQSGTFSGTSSGTNTGDQTSIVGITGTKAQFDTAVSDGNILYVGDVTPYTDELAQDAVGAMVDSTLVYVDGTPLLTRAALTGDVTATQASNATTIAAGVVTLTKMADIASSSLIYRKTVGTGSPEVNTLATLKTDLGLTGTNSGDQSTIVGISSTKAQFDTACSDGNFLYVGDIGSTSITTLGTITTGTWDGTDIGVTAGGTGLSTLTTAYAPICAGTTPTGALQVASTGLSTAGYVLTSTGANSLPTFQSAAAGSVNIKQTEIDFGTTPLADMSFIIVDVDVNTGSQLLAHVAYEAPTSKDLDEIEMDILDIRCGPGSGQFTMYVSSADGSYLADKFKINYLVG